MHTFGFGGKYFLSKKKKVNEGEVPQYYVENNHQAIISPSVFEEAQHQMAARHSGKNRASSMGVFSGRIKCADCGGWYGSKVWHSNSKYRKTIWQCNHKFDGGEKSKGIGKNQKVYKKSKGIKEKSKSVRKNRIVSKTAFT